MGVDKYLFLGPRMGDFSIEGLEPRSKFQNRKKRTAQDRDQNERTKGAQENITTNHSGCLMKVALQRLSAQIPSWQIADEKLSVPSRFGEEVTTSLRTMTKA